MRALGGKKKKSKTDKGYEVDVLLEKSHEYDWASTDAEAQQKWAATGKVYCCWCKK